MGDGSVRIGVETFVVLPVLTRGGASCKERAECSLANWHTDLSIHHGQIAAGKNEIETAINAVY